MADAIISVVIEQISNLLIQEIGSVSSAREDVERLQAELKRMQCFLKDADRKRDQDERVRNWVSEIRELAYDADDIIDTFLLQFVGVNKFNGIKFLHLHKIDTQVKSICAKLADISNSLQTYGIKFINEGEESSLRRVRRSDPEEEDKDVISHESSITGVMGQLMQVEDQLRVVSIVGMGGLGKTTLAKKVYNRIDVKQHFDCCSWSFISQQFSPRDVLYGILKEIAPTTSTTSSNMVIEDEVVKELKNALKEKRYLVVLDDVWKEEAWDSLKQAFPKGKEGSKILFTSRSRQVALYADPRSCPVEPPFLTDEQSWELLKKKAFLEDRRNSIAEYEKFGKEMVRKCGRLPLAVAVLGGLLGNKSLKEWEVWQRDISAQLIKLQERSQYAGVNWILELSYNDLPFRLKPCFLYLSQFPEDYEIRRKRLIRMWIAEGFIPQPPKGGDETMLDIGEQYLEELVDRCMVQVSQMDDYSILSKRHKTYRMHDLMRDMCVLKAKEENFLGVVEHVQENNSSSVLPLARRIGIHYGQRQPKSEVPIKECGPRLRSLLYFVPSGNIMTEHQVSFSFKNFKLLRVLNIQRVNLCHIPRNISHLIHLRYLGLDNAYLARNTTCISPPFTLPASIENMKSLTTLDLRNIVARIPNVLWKLQGLRHLFLHAYRQRNLRLDTLRNLETLKWVKPKNLIRNDAMLKLTNLRNLAIEFMKTEEARVVLKSQVPGLGRLRTLKLKITNGNCLSNGELLSGCQSLTKLEIEGPIPEDGQLLKLLPESLTKLTLVMSGLKQDPMAILEKLPKLRYLSLHYNYKGSKMVCSANCFHQLEFLELGRLKELEEWEINEGAMPNLKELYIIYLKKLKTIPQGLKFLTTLRKLVLHDNRESFKRGVQVIGGVEGEHFDKVRHIPFIIPVFP